MKKFSKIFSSTTVAIITLVILGLIFKEPIRIIATNLWKGNRNTNVKTLQQFLISQNNGKVAQALAKVGATSCFGVLTRAALAEFQSKVGISPAWGNFGPITRAYLSANY